MSLVLAADYRVPDFDRWRALLRSPGMFSWFDSAGVQEIPPMFAGEVVEKLNLVAESASSGSATPTPWRRSWRRRARVPARRCSSAASCRPSRFRSAEMYICLCLGVTTHTVQEAIDDGARTTKKVAEACGAGSVCGRCGHTIRTVIEASAPDSPGRIPGRLRRRWGQHTREVLAGR